jgi:transposase
MGDTLLSVRERVIALNLHTTKSHLEIANDLHLCRSTVTRIINLHKKTGSVKTLRNGRCGRKGKLSKRDKRMLLRESVKDPQKTARECQDTVGDAIPSVSIATVKRVLRNGGRLSYRPPKAHLLDIPKMRRRFSWAQRHIHFEQDFWNTVRFALHGNLCIYLMICHNLCIFRSFSRMKQ